MSEEVNKSIIIKLSRTQHDYIESDAVVNLIYGSKGEGKTLASIAGFIRHAQRCKKNIRAAIVRDTHENIKISTARSIMDALPAGSYKFKNDCKQCIVYSEPTVDIDLFGIDDLSAVSKLQGPEYAIIWLEEPAPIADAQNAGLSEDVFNASLASCARQRNTVPRLQISMNPGNDEHWTFRRFFTDVILNHEGKYILDANFPLITLRIFRIKVGENKFLSTMARQATAAAYGNDPQSYQRYVQGQFAKVYKGKKVTPDYNKDGRNYSKNILIPAQGLIGFRGYDSWQNPAVVLGQITNTGRLVFIDTCRILGSDIRTLIKTQVVPLLESPRWKGKCKGWRDIGDYTMKIHDQSNINESAAKFIQSTFGNPFESGPTTWEHMRTGLIRALNDNTRGLPSVVIGNQNKLLHNALSGGWHYKTDKAGNVTSNIPMKNEDSHIGDCFANIVNVLLPERKVKIDRGRWADIVKRTKDRVASY